MRAQAPPDTTPEMFALPFTLGVAGGVAAGGIMIATGMIRERGASAVALIAIAAFWPVFAVASSQDVVLHLAVFAAFFAAALLGYRTALIAIAGGLALHAAFDAAIGLRDHPGPAFWPAFCAGIDAALAGVIAIAVVREQAR